MIKAHILDLVIKEAWHSIYPVNPGFGAGARREAGPHSGIGGRGKESPIAGEGNSRRVIGVCIDVRLQEMPQNGGFRASFRLLQRVAPRSPVGCALCA